jgi:hypothetical protein
VSELGKRSRPYRVGPEKAVAPQSVDRSFLEGSSGGRQLRESSKGVAKPPIVTASPDVERVSQSIDLDQGWMT